MLLPRVSVTVLMLPVLMLMLMSAGCTTTPPRPAASTRSAPSSSPPLRPLSPLRLDASVAQFRFDEGTSNLKAGVTNTSRRDIRVTRATIRWDALAFATVVLPGDAVHPGQTAAFTITYGRVRCARAPTTRPVLVAEVDGRRLRLPLRVEDPGLLVRLQAKVCAQQRLDQAAGIRLRLASHTERVAGQEYLPGTLVVRRRSGTETVRVVDLGGSVLIDLVPRGGRRALPGELPARRRTLVFPVLFGSAHRCDAHALGQSSQTFLLSAYLRLGSRPTQRLVLPLSSSVKDRLLGVVHRDCR